MTKAPPTLEDLRQAEHAAWLWDGARGRIVWANAAGIRLFDGQSMFDLIDRPFDGREAGIETIAELTRSLQRGEIQQTLLSFPSVGLLVPFECQCNLHSLADGRAGLLVVEVKADVKDSSLGFMAAAFQHMPMAVGFVESDGRLNNLNAAASNLFSAKKLSELICQASRADDILNRLKATALVSQVETINGVLGIREVRMTLQRLTDAPGPYALMMVDDVTERRALERQMAAPVQSQTHDVKAFENLAQVLKDTIKQDSAEKNAAVEAPKKVTLDNPAAKSDPMLVPRTILHALEQTGAAIAISKDGKPAFVSLKAATLFGYGQASELFSDETFWTSIGNIKSTSAKVTVQIGTGQSFQLAAKASQIPWLSGPAQQLVFEAVKVDREKQLTKPKQSDVPASVEPASTMASVATSEIKIAADDDLKRILDIASDGIVTLDRDGKVLSFSAGAEAIFGYRTAEVIDKPLLDFFAPESRQSFSDYLAGLEGPGLAAVFNDGREMLGIVKQGGTVPMFITLGRMASATSRAAYAVVMRDITTWKRTEKELREAKDVAEEASRQKSEFLARISHELRTPLNAIIGFSEVMRMGQFGEIKNEKYRGYINDIHASGGHLLSLINDLLDLSKIEAGKLELNFTAVSVVDSAEHAMRLLQDVATRGRVLVRKSLPDNLPRVVADLRALRQVMLNILSNAIKFTDPGGQVIISGQLTRDGELALSIKDTGIGMNSDQIKDALEPFKRVETAGRETQGTGLGLSLTKALVEANRAKFNLSSEPGRGTLIEIVFPTTRVLAE